MELLMHIEVPDHELRHIRKVYDLPDTIQDTELARLLVQKLVWGYFSPTYFNRKYIEGIVSDVVEEG